MLLNRPEMARIVVFVALACGCAVAPDSIQLSELPDRPLAAGRGRSTLANPNEPLIASVDSDDADASTTLCDVVQLIASPQAPEIMIVLDRSTSMEQGGRWRPSVSAVRELTAKLESAVRFGLMVFPGTRGFFAAEGGLRCSPGDIIVPVATQNSAAIGRALMGTRPNGGTPTSQTLEKLLDSYASAAAPDADAHAKYVLLVTDGAPTCPSGSGTETTQPDIDATNRAIEALRDQQVRTYVVGYDTTGAGNEMLESVLDGFAARGGTGDQRHRPVENEASLVSELQKIASAITSCDFRLDRAPASADHVLVELDDQQLNLGDADGWQLVGDRTIRLLGAACERFRAGVHSVNAEIRCAIVSPS